MAKASSLLRLLIVDDSLTDTDGIINILRDTGHSVRADREQSLEGIEKSLKKHTWDLLICRDTLVNTQPEHVVKLIRKLDQDLPCIILVTDIATVESYYQIGVQDVIAFDDAKRLQFAVDRELSNLAILRDCRNHEQVLHETERRVRLLLEGSNDAVAYIHEGVHIYVNQAYLILFGYEQIDDVDGLPILDSISRDDHGKFKGIIRQFSKQTDSDSEIAEVHCVRADGSGFKANIHFSHTCVNGEQCVQIIIRAKNTVDDISDVVEVVEGNIQQAEQAQNGEENKIEYEQPIVVQEEQQDVISESSEQYQFLKQAVQNDDFCLHFQAIIPMYGRDQEFYEVLLRCKDKTKSNIEQIVEDATTLGLMIEIDKWVIRNALDALDLHRQDHPQACFFVKLSEQALLSQEFIDWLRPTLDSHKVDGSALIFEISEVVVKDSLEHAKTMIAQLKEMSCGFALEHFGIDFDVSRSLSVLDVDYLKINGSFVEDMTTNSEKQAAVKTIIEITKLAGKISIAERVSNANSLALLWGLEVDYAQGYYIHEPSAQLDYNFDEDDEE